MAEIEEMLRSENGGNSGDDQKDRRENDRNIHESVDTLIRPMGSQNPGNHAGGPEGTDNNPGNHAGRPGGTDNNPNVLENQESNDGGLGAGGGGEGNLDLNESDSSEDDDDDDDEIDESTEEEVSSVIEGNSNLQNREEAPLIQNTGQPRRAGRRGKEWREKRREKKAGKKREKAEKKAGKKREKAEKKVRKSAEKAKKKEKKKQARNPGAEQGNDAINMAAANVVLNAGGIDHEEEQPGADPNRAFDTLKDLNALNAPEGAFKPEEGATDDEKNWLELKEKVYKTRKEGQLYRAVIHLKMMDEGKEPASEEKALQKKDAGKGPNRFSRFMNSSKVQGAGHLMDQAGQIAKITGGVTGVASYFDEDLKNSKTNSIVGMVSSIIAGVNSIRGLIKKVVTLVKNRKKLKIRQKIFMVIGIATDLANTLSKAAALAKAIEGFAGRGQGLVATVADKWATISGMVGQMGIITAQLNSLHTMRKEIEEAGEIEEAQVKKAEKVMERYAAEEGDLDQQVPTADGNLAPGNDDDAPLASDDIDNSDTDNSDTDNSDTNNNDIDVDNHLANGEEREEREEREELPPAEKKKALRERIRARRLKRKEKKEEKKGKKEEEKKRKKREAGDLGTLQRRQFVKRAASFVQREDVTDADKEPVILFLGFRRVRKKKVGASQIGVSNLISTVLGLGANAFKTASLYNPDEDWLKDLSGKASLTSSVGLLGSSVANHFIKKRMGDKGDTGNQEETGMIKNRLYGMVKGIADDKKYGLRGAAAALEGEPTDEKKAEVKNVVKRYEEVDKSLKGMGVNYGSLLQANNRDAFKDALIAGM